MIVNHQTGECSLPDCFCHEAQRTEQVSGAPTGCACDPDVNYWCDLHGQERAEYMAQHRPALTPTPDFTREWDTAPRGMTNYVEQDVAEFWYRRGMLAGKDAATVLQSEDLKEMARVARERVGR